MKGTNTMEPNKLENLESVTEETPVEETSIDETPAAEENGKPKKQKKGFWRELGEWVVSLVAALVIVWICHNFLFTLIRVDGASMNTTLSDGERLFVSVPDVKFGGDVERGAVVICHYPNRGRTYFVKRVVAVPGDSVWRENGVTFVSYTDADGSTIIEPLDAQFVGLFYNPNNDYEPYTLGEDEYFVVGDNRGNSHDSRDWNDSDPSRDVGPITKDMITGRVRCVFWPLDSIRAVE